METKNKSKISIGKQTTKPWSVLILEKLVEVGKGYTRPLSYQELESIYWALGPMRIFISRPGYSRKVYNLKKKGYITKGGTGPKRQIRITKKGLAYLRARRREDLKIEKPTSWDGKWRLVIFDIPESQKLNRNAFRFRLKYLGFEQVQKSVWAHAYPCANVVAELCSRYKIEPYVSLFEGIYTGDDQELRQVFGLR